MEERPNSGNGSREEGVQLVAPTEARNGSTSRSGTPRSLTPPAEDYRHVNGDDVDENDPFVQWLFEWLPQ